MENGRQLWPWSGPDSHATCAKYFFHIEILFHDVSQPGLANVVQHLALPSPTPIRHEDPLCHRPSGYFAGNMWRSKSKSPMSEGVLFCSKSRVPQS